MPYRTAPSPRLWREWALALACAALGVAVALVPWIINRRFYFHDDIQHWYMPLFYHIGHALREGQVPFLSLANFTTSNLLGEYQTGLFNPLLLAVFAVLPSFETYTTAGLFFVAVHMAVFGAGLFVLGRSYDLPRAVAILFAAAALTNNMLSYWYAGSWVSVLYPTCWLVWAWAALSRAAGSSAWRIAAVVFSYLTIASGFPNVTLLLGLIGALLAWGEWKRTGISAAAIPLLAVAAAGLLASIPLLALLSMGSVSVRSTATFNGGFLVPDLRDVLAFSSPFHRAPIAIFGGYRTIAVPIFYAAWFAAPLLAFVNWKSVRFGRAPLLPLAMLVGVLLLLTQGPEQVYLMRWPFRWLPFFHLGLLLLVLLLVSSEPKVDRRRAAIATGLVVLQLVLSFQAFPTDILLHLAGALTTGLGLLLLWAARGRNGVQAIAAVGVTLAIFVATHLVYPANTDLPDRGIPAAAGASWGATVPAGYTFYAGHFGNEGDPARLGEYGTGLIPLNDGEPMINGYTPLGHRALSAFLCSDIFGVVCADAAPRLLSTDAETAVPLADLFRIRRLIVMRGDYLQQVEPRLGPEWQLEGEGTYTRRFRRDLPNGQLPGTLSWVPAGAAVEGAENPQFTREALRVRTGDTPAKLVFARLFWPGYGARLDGEPLPVSAHLDMLVSIEVPPGADGVVELTYTPPHLVFGLIGTGAGALLAMFMVPWRGGRAAHRSAEPVPA